MHSPHRPALLHYRIILKNNCHTITNFLLSIEYQWTKAMIVGMTDAYSIYHTITNRLLSIEYQWTKAMIVGMMDAFSIYHTVINCLSDIFLHMTYFQ